MSNTGRILVLAAHPDDAEISAGGLLARHCRLGSSVRIVSVTDGRSGHHRIDPRELVAIRRAEARAAGERIGADYVTWDFPDGRLVACLEVREAVIGGMRGVARDLVLTRRPYDYHPDHRAVGLAVQDASYLVTVPHICPRQPALAADPVVAYMTDLFTRPYRQRGCSAGRHRGVRHDCADGGLSPVPGFQWLPHHDGLEVPPAARIACRGWRTG